MTATEAGHSHRRSLTDWWRGRSWSKDLDTLARLHKSLRALDVGGDADGDGDAEPEPLTAPALPSPSAGPLAPPRDEATPQHDEPEPAPPPDQFPPPVTADPQETADPPEPPDEPRPDGKGEPVAGLDPAIAAVKETFRYVAEAGDKAVGYFYAQLFLRQPHRFRRGARSRHRFRESHRNRHLAPLLSHDAQSSRPRPAPGGLQPGRCEGVPVAAGTDSHRPGYRTSAVGGS